MRSYPRGRIVNDYILGRGAASYEEVADTGFGHGFGELDANRELVEWMREYNADPAHETKLHFYGFDIPGKTGGPTTPRESLQNVLDYLTDMDREVGLKYQAKIDELSVKMPIGRIPWTGAIQLNHRNCWQD